jgi:hypothetical protein
MLSVVAEVEETTPKLIAETMRSFSQILKAVTEIEEAGGQPFDEVLKKLFSPEKLAEMRNTQTSTPAASLFKLASEAPKLQNLQAHTTEEKKKTSNEIRNSRNHGKNSRVEAMTIQLPPPTALPTPQLHAAVATAPNAAATLTAEIALQAVKALIGAQVRIEEDPDWGPTYVITLDAGASEALRINLELQKTLPGVPIVVEWTGPTDISNNELLQRLVEITHAGGFRTRATGGIDIVKEVSQQRDRWPT